MPGASTPASHAQMTAMAREHAGMESVCATKQSVKEAFAIYPQPPIVLLDVQTAATGLHFVIQGADASYLSYLCD